MILKSPAIRISIVLVLFTVNLLFVAKLIGFIPDEARLSLEMRKAFSESLALQFSVVAEKGEYRIIQRTLSAVVKRNDDIRSAAIRTVDGQLLAIAGEHLANWEAPADGKSTATHVNVPLFKKDKKWADVEIRFTPLLTQNLLSGFKNSFTGLVIYFSLSCFICYFLILKRTLRELDPSAVIPGRVQNAFDVLNEGVMILDKKEQIVMTNNAFAQLFGKSPKEMVGLKGSELGWLDYQTHEHIRQLPWVKVLKDELDQATASLSMMSSLGAKTKLIVNATMIPSSSGKSRGSLVTFDDITELEEKNFDLESNIDKLQMATEEIQLKNQELKNLANLDPLTLCLNRRSLSLHFETLFTQAIKEGLNLSCMMVDIDFFKSVNDTYGHSTGDQVIKRVADTLKTSTRDTDLISRYGGEEFVVVLPGLDLKKASQIAERIRKFIEERPCSGISITISLGVSSIASNASSANELIDQADKALYTAKETGRNRVVTWEKEFVTVTEAGTEAKRQGQTSTPEKALTIPADETQLQTQVLELEELVKKRTLELEHYKLYDFGTGLPTRSLFEDRILHEITRSQRINTMIAVMSVSIDMIKRIHETFGHNASEQLTKACGHRLNDVLRQYIDTVAIMDDINETATISLINQTEFGILLTDINQADHVTWIMKRMLDSFEDPFQINDNEIYVSAYLGVSISPHDGNTVEELYSGARNACNFAQTISGKERYLFASDDLNKKADRQLKIESLLHEAIQKDELQLYYQPKINTATGQIHGFEALIRWQNEQLGFVPPDHFIPIAEQSSLINKIGEWVIETACRQIRTWVDSGMEVGSIAVNLSGRQLYEQNLPGRIQEIMNEFRIDNQQLEIELTESVFVKPDGRTTTTLNQINDLGLRISMDDFGTGYSSLAYLRGLPLSILKIDQSFVMDINKNENANRLIASIISIAHSLDLEVVAEGVEEKFQADLLTKLGCEYLQGYYFSRPVPSHKVDGLIQEQQTAVMN
jgi:diguanylate cyclase (GGDEF)-like protein/PAS domain S-box-containing protein